MNGYELSRNFIDYSFENPTKIKPNHYALFFFAIEHCNRLGWKQNFGLPTTMTMEAVGIRSYNTYSKTFNELVEFGFFKCLEKSKNQYSANIIALSNFNKALDKALDKAFIKHGTKQKESTEQSNCSIDKQITINNKPINKEQSKLKFTKKTFKKELLALGVQENYLDDWLVVRTQKKASFTETSLKTFLNECTKHNFSVPEAVRICAEQDWKGFKVEWVNNLNNKNGKSNNNNQTKLERDLANAEQNARGW